MNRFLTGIAISATLFLAQACSSAVQSEQTTAANRDPHAGHSMHDMDSHAGHQMGDTQSAAEAKLTIPQNVTANKPVPLVINIQDSAGKARAKFDTFHTKLRHLIVVSDDLKFFSHLHPEYKGNGRFGVNASFPNPGSYSLLSDYKPSGQKEQVSLMNAQVAGKQSSPAPTVNLNRSKTFGKTRVNFKSFDTPLKAGKEVMLMFELLDASTNQTIYDLQPYLGEKGHLVILRQSPSLTRADYIHAHATNEVPWCRGTASCPAPAPGIVVFKTQFPQPGKYKLWGQFNRQGKIVTADFWVNVI